ncbi:hypothetical protein L3Q82_007134 [Scortum barcoo]|uniref:Uncharacterized protein n=1 Tax=Scortum barcoo TaxID=214431 RepID=A0ACB8WSM3_9TELE|nr:hypothetical protein L3Q82_007134 [Scortum barcoo]
MSAASCLLTEDQFLCSICLDVFTDPVSTPCGHNFCKTCITEHWNTNVLCQCPNCNKVFYTRPELQVNTFISEMAAQFRQSAQQKASSSSSEQQVSKPGEVPCDVCTGTKLKALKSCLVCLAGSYCETHLEPHLTMAGLKRHQLMEPVENLEGRMCMKHDKLLELFFGVELSKEGADREIADGVQVFTALKESVERSQAELIHTIKEKQRKTEKQAEGFIKELEQEISELKKRSSEVKQLSQSEDHLHLLQSFPSLNAAPPTKDWTEVSVHPPSYEGTVVRAVNQLEETLSKLMKKLFETELKRVQQYAVDVTLDPDTAHPELILSDDGKQISCGDVEKKLPDNPERFDTCPVVLAKQSFSSGRFYYEVQSVDMSAASCLLTEDQFLCSICLDVFTDPVSTPCGHNFCKTCEHWNTHVQRQCPNCNKVFYTRPELQVNTFISEMAAQFRQSAQQKASSSSSEQQVSKPGEVEIQQMIQKRRLKIEEIKQSVELSKEGADREIADGVQVFTALKESVERSQAELIHTIKEKQRKTEKQAEGFIKELEQKISELKKRSYEVKQLSQSEDHLHLLQSFPSLNAAPPTKELDRSQRPSTFI